MYAANAMSWMVLTLSGEPLTLYLPCVELDVGHVGLEEMRGDQLALVAQLARDHRRCGATDRRRARRVGAQTERRVVGVALTDLDVGRGDPELLGDDLRERRLVPLALRLHAELEDRLAGRMHAQLGGVEHAQAGDVVVLALAGADHLGEAGDADAHQLAPGALLGLLLAELVVAEHVERDLHRAWVVAAVVLEAGRGLVREGLGLDEVVEPGRDRVLSELDRRALHQPLDEVRGLGDPERAAIRHAAGCLVGVRAVGHDVRGRDVVRAGHDVEEAGLELARLRIREERAVVAEQVHAKSDELPVLIDGERRRPCSSRVRSRSR